MPIRPVFIYYWTAFIHDILRHLEQTELFTNIELRGATVDESTLTFTCFLEDGLKTQKEVADVLERVWIEAPISYSKGERAHKVTIGTGELQMEFAVLSNKLSICGVIEVLGFK